MLARQRILESQYRASGRFKVVPYLDLGVREQRLLVSLASGEPERSGMLAPTRAGVSARAVDGDTVRLLASLSQPGPLPRNLMIALGERGPTTIARMVLDGVLEVETAGRFLTGADASPVVFSPALTSPRASGCGAMSLAAVDYGASLRIDDPIVVSRRMYRFNTQPATPQQLRRFPDRRAVSRLLGLDVLDDRVLGKPGLEPDEGGGWFSWTLVGSDVPPHEGPYFKLYVSPPVERLAETFHVVSNLLVNRTGAVSFKVGANLRGILRPDKLVAYFTTRADLDTAAAAVRTALADTPAQGVPFTAGLDESGLLSWGMDPPRDRATVEWLGVESWRLWMTNQLASALAVARGRQDEAISPSAFAVARLSLEGVDVSTWTPPPDLWADGGH